MAGYALIWRISEVDGKYSLSGSDAGLARLHGDHPCFHSLRDAKDYCEMREFDITVRDRTPEERPPGEEEGPVAARSMGTGELLARMSLTADLRAEAMAVAIESFVLSNIIDIRDRRYCEHLIDVIRTGKGRMMMEAQSIAAAAKKKDVSYEKIAAMDGAIRCLRDSLGALVHTSLKSTWEDLRVLIAPC